ncbi:hypothetical protein B9Q00_04020 [Candidatus Marsarchaeota G1 archaeon OSP_C]|uniref:Phosphate-starvation-inducible E-like protein n=3 Tax=Candidatus Marsarchaeota group 1 TaxID=2203770 RepID=A0A2R6AR45_9ARCH|nr:MAG: hypothetical protein B9Q00_04020 [Candidatus Marsarchaeota G1 archaeon OSP_C]
MSDQGFPTVMGKIVDYLVMLLAFITLVALIFGVYKLSLDLFNILNASTFDIGAKNFVIDTLTVFVVLELMLGFLQYHGKNRISPSYIIDAGIFFVTRELMIELYAGNTTPLTFVSFAAIIGVLGLVRAVLTKISPT